MSFDISYTIERARQARLAKEEEEARLEYREMLASDVEKFYNMDHDPDTGRFDVGSDGPGRKRENTAKSEQTIGKKAPQWMKDMLSRKRGAAVKKGADLLPKNAPQNMKDLMKRKMEESVVNPKTPAKTTPAKPKVETTVPVSQTDKGGTINRIDAAEIMHGTDSKQHKAAKAKFGPKELKSESSGKHPASDYAYVPEGDKSSGWKLRLTAKPGGKPDARIVGAAVAALGKGFRGHKVEIPAKDRPAVIAKVRSAWLAANPKKTKADLPSVLQDKSNDKGFVINSPSKYTDKGFVQTPKTKYTAR